MTESIDLTQTIRKLSVPVDTVEDAFEEQGGTALLLCRDNDSRKWGPRWLSQCGLQASVPPDPANALQIARSTQPDVIVVEAALIGAGAEPVFKMLLDAADLQCAVIVLCANPRELKAAMEAGAFDIGRKPFDWQAIGNRARHALQLKNKQLAINESTNALQQALKIANTARKLLRSQETHERG